MIDLLPTGSLAVLILCCAGLGFLVGAGGLLLHFTKPPEMWSSERKTNAELRRIHRGH